MTAGESAAFSLELERVTADGLSMLVRDTVIAVLHPPDSVTGVRPGRTWLVAAAVGTDVRDSVAVIVDPRPIMDCFGIAVTPTTITLHVGETVQLTTTGPDCWNSTVSFESSAPGTAAVDSTGRITGVSPGTAEVIAYLTAKPATRVSASVTVIP